MDTQVCTAHTCMYDLYDPIDSIIELSCVSSSSHCVPARPPSILSSHLSNLEGPVSRIVHIRKHTSDEQDSSLSPFTVLAECQHSVPFGHLVPLNM